MWALWRCQGPGDTWLHVGQDWLLSWQGWTGTEWGGSGLAYIPRVTAGCCHPMDGTCPSCWVASAGEDRDRQWLLAHREPSARPAHVCCSRVCLQPPLPGPQMVARKRRPVPPPLVHHHASLAPWPYSPAGVQGWEQLGHPEPGWEALHAHPPVGHSTPPGSHPALVRGQVGRLWGPQAAEGSWQSPPASQMVPLGAVTMQVLPWRPHDVASSMTSD